MRTRACLLAALGLLAPAGATARFQVVAGDGGDELWLNVGPFRLLAGRPRKISFFWNLCLS